jgi:hypothetical protein
MNKILVALVMLISATSSHGMEKETKNSSLMTLSQFYYHFSHDLGLLPEITQQIFSFQCGDVNHTKVLDELKQSSNDLDRFLKCIEALISACGELLASEICECFFVREKILICDIKNEYKSTCLHHSKNPKVIQILLRVAGDNAFKLLIMQRSRGCTALHDAAFGAYTETVKLLLSSAGKKVCELLMIQDDTGWTALHSAAYNNNHIECVELLLNAAGNNAQDLIMLQTKAGTTALNLAHDKPRLKEFMQNT